MGKNVIRLTESQLKEIIRSAADMALNETDGKTLSGVPDAATIVRADEMMPGAIQSFLAPYKNFQFMFFAHKRTGIPVHLLFNVDNIKKNMGGMSILSGNVIFGNEQLPGDLQIEFGKDKDENMTNKVFYKYKGNSYKYALTPDNRTVDKWNELVNELVKSQSNVGL